MLPTGTGIADVDVFGMLWGKSRAGGRVNLLLQHLLDAAAVAELMWDHFVAPTVQNKIDACCGGQGRSLLGLLCGLHDVGKASPAFQVKVPELARRVQDAGLAWRPLGLAEQRWHHSLAGAVVLRRALREAGWDRAAIDWVWPLIAGHHGSVPSVAKIQPPGLGHAQGLGRWASVQDRLVRRVASELDVDLTRVAPAVPPTRARQLTVAGLVVMADWIASDVRHFPGVDDLREVSMRQARERAGAAWDRLRLRGGWSPSCLPRHLDLLAARFGLSARRVQADVVELAERMTAPGLLIVEAPMGEGKTEAALEAAEVLARRFGADGVFVGMPTQATSDPMFTRVRRWASSIEPGLPVSLLHGKRQFNREWRDMQRQVHFDGVDEFGCDDVYGLARGGSQPTGDIPPEWFLSRKRGLLAPLTVGTVDQLLHAATRTRHVMLRQAGLAGRVVVLDEVHAYDVYMAQFLFEALRWLVDAGVPVVLLSATLPPRMRAELVSAYLQGALAERDVDLPDLMVAGGYPSTSSTWVADGVSRFEQRASAPWRPSTAVGVEVLDESVDGDPEPVATLLRQALRGGGCALVVRNTVARAQRTYLAVKEAFGADAVLLHARLTAAARADRTEHLLDLLGPPGRPEGAQRPRRLVVVATQLAEQSFDVDADLLVTDLAPIDLLLQRVGRLHRYDRPQGDRPPRVRSPRVVVTGMACQGAGPPRFPPGSSYVYGDHLLIRAAALVLEAAGGWSVPAQVPDLVARGYGDQPLGPNGWAGAAEEARATWQDEQRRRRANAQPFLLAGPDDLGKPTLAGLHELSTADLDDDDKVAAVVRDGEQSVEVILVRRSDRGFLSLGGRGLGVHGEAVSDEAVLEEVIQAAVRLPARPELTTAAREELRPLPGWPDQDPWLRRTRALVLDDAMSARLGGRLLTYDPELGLIDERDEA